MRDIRISPNDIFDEGLMRRLFDTINSLLSGKTNNVGTLTLTASVASTSVSNPLFESSQVPIFVPLTANAAAELGAGTMYVSARTTGQFTVTHANNAQTDRTFGYIFVG